MRESQTNGYVVTVLPRTPEKRNLHYKFLPNKWRYPGRKSRQGRSRRTLLGL